MIKISRPFIETSSSEVFLCSNIYDGARSQTFKTWYSVDHEYSKYLCDDRADAFLMLVFIRAMKSHQDIEIEAPVSPRLLFNLENTIQPLFEKIIPGGKRVKIHTSNDRLKLLNGHAVGCGCSLGVDSLSSFLKHYGENVTEGYHATHLALFNSCQFGYLDMDSSTKAFRQAVEDLKPFSEEVKMPIVAVNSNLNDFFLHESGFNNAKSRFIPSTLSCVLALQGLFGKYVFASSYPIEKFAISQIDHSHAESAFVPLMSTDSTEIILSNPCMDRVEKTRFISSHPLTKKYLNVCWADQMSNGGNRNSKWLEGKTKKNCGWCDKCLRTLFTLELLGCDLNPFKEIFDLEKYYCHKNEFILNVLVNNSTNIFYSEIYQLMKEKDYHIPLFLRFKSVLVKILRTIRI